MTKKNLVWRLSKLPTPEELVELVKNKIITQEEAKEILLSSETKEDSDIKSLESEIEFLKKLVLELGKTRNQIVESIKYIEEPYRDYPWYRETFTSLCGNTTDGTIEIKM